MNAIGLNNEKAKRLADGLNELLANYQIFYANVRGFHWNIRGNKFFELHLKFEELYTDVNIKVDEIAERILTLGFKPEYRYSSYIIGSQIKECSQTSEGENNVKSILEGLKLILQMQRSIMVIAQEAQDEGTASQMSDYVRAQEKLVWMYSAFLNK